LNIEIKVKIKGKEVTRSSGSGRDTEDSERKRDFSNGAAVSSRTLLKQDSLKLTRNPLFT
jgi:hypothetical protein